MYVFTFDGLIKVLEEVCTRNSIAHLGSKELTPKFNISLRRRLFQIKSEKQEF
jgi:hypothetical protein